MKKSELKQLIRECYSDILLEAKTPLTNNELESAISKILTVYEVGYKIDGDNLILYDDNHRITLKILNGTKNK